MTFFNVPDPDPWRYVVAIVGEDDFFLHKGDDKPWIFSSLVEAVHEGKKMWGVEMNNTPAIVYRFRESLIDIEEWEDGYLVLNDRFEAQYVLFNDIKWTRDFWFDIFREMMLGKTGEAIRLINSIMDDDPHYFEAKELIEQHTEVFAYKVTLVNTTTNRVEVANTVRRILGLSSIQVVEIARPTQEPIVLHDALVPGKAQELKAALNELGALVRLEAIY